MIFLLTIESQWVNVCTNTSSRHAHKSGKKENYPLTVSLCVYVFMFVSVFMWNSSDRTSKHVSSDADNVEANKGSAAAQRDFIDSNHGRCLPAAGREALELYGWRRLSRFSAKETLHRSIRFVRVIWQVSSTHPNSFILGQKSISN